MYAMETSQEEVELLKKPEGKINYIKGQKKRPQMKQITEQSNPRQPGKIIFWYLVPAKLKKVSSQSRMMYGLVWFQTNRGPRFYFAPRHGLFQLCILRKKRGRHSVGLCKHSPKDMPQTKGSKNTKFSGKLKLEMRRKKMKQRLSRIKGKMQKKMQMRI